MNTLFYSLKLIFGGCGIETVIKHRHRPFPSAAVQGPEIVPSAAIIPLYLSSPPSSVAYFFPLVYLQRHHLFVYFFFFIPDRMLYILYIYIYNYIYMCIYIAKTIQYKIHYNTIIKKKKGSHSLRPPKMEAAFPRCTATNKEVSSSTMAIT